MFKVIYLRKIKYVLLLFVLSTIVFSINYMFIPTTNNSVAKKIIVLDAGHGGEDGGAKSESGIIEKDLNLLITMKVKEMLESNGYKVILTRDSDIMLGQCEGTFKKKKVADIYKRVEVVNKSNADMVISIHMNSFPEGKYSGFQTFYKRNCVYSSEIAKNIQQCMLNETNIQNDRVSMEIKGVKLIESSTIPAILVECGFLSNENEANLLNTEEYQNKIAKGIVDGISKWYE